MHYLITYDLKDKTKDYGPLYEAIKGYGNWWHYLDSTWLISSPDSISTWYTRIKAKIDQNDNFLIVELSSSKPYTGWLPQKAWDWIKSHLR